MNKLFEVNNKVIYDIDTTILPDLWTVLNKPSVYAGL